MKQPEKKSEQGKTGQRSARPSPSRNRGTEDRPVRQDTARTNRTSGRTSRPNESGSRSGKNRSTRPYKPETPETRETPRGRSPSRHRPEQDARSRRPNPAGRALNPELHDAQTQFARAQANLEAADNDSRSGRAGAARAMPSSAAIMRSGITADTTKKNPALPRSGDMEGVQVRQPLVPANLSGYVDLLLDAIDTAVPIPAAHRKDLKFAIRDLSRELTSERTERRRD